MSILRMHRKRVCRAERSGAFLIERVDVESIFFLLMETVRQIGMNEECKTVCVSLCKMVMSSTMSNSLKARLYGWSGSVPVVSLFSSTLCRPSSPAVRLFCRA